jgi:hypothetical protein
MVYMFYALGGAFRTYLLAPKGGWQAGVIVTIKA